MDIILATPTRYILTDPYLTDIKESIAQAKKKVITHNRSFDKTDLGHTYLASSILKKSKNEIFPHHRYNKLFSQRNTTYNSLNLMQRTK